MNRKIFFKITLDIIMAATFALLFNKFAAGGLEFHEIAGLLIGLTFIIHKILNREWIKHVTCRLFSYKIPFKTRFGYAIDVILLISMAYIIISGILISHIIFPEAHEGKNIFLIVTHISVSYLALVFIGIHLGLHWSWIMLVFRKQFKIPVSVKFTSYIAKICAVAFFSFSAYTIYAENFISQLERNGIFFGIEQPRPQRAPGSNNGFSPAQVSQGENNLSEKMSSADNIASQLNTRSAETPRTERKFNRNSGGRYNKPEKGKNASADSGKTSQASALNERDKDGKDNNTGIKDVPKNTPAIDHLSLIITIFSFITFFCVLTHYIGRLLLFFSKK